MAKVDSMTGLTRAAENKRSVETSTKAVPWRTSQLMAVPKSWGKKFFSPEEESEGVTTFLSS